MLLEEKYDYFSGGFLQAHHLVGYSQRGLFVAEYMIINIFVIGGTSAIWFRVANILRISMYYSVYYFSLTIGSIYIITTGVKYQLLKYFSDAASFGVLRSIAGGTTKGMLLYVADELRIVYGLALMWLAVAVAGHLFVRRFAVQGQVHRTPVPTARQVTLRSVGVSVAFAAVALGSVFVVNRNDDVRYGLAQTISYGLVTDALEAVFPMGADRFDTRLLTAGLPVGALNFVPKPARDPVFPPRPMNLVVVVLESTRAEAVGKRVDGRVVAPNLTALAEQGTSARHAYSHAGFTVESVKAIFTASFGAAPPSESLFSILRNHGYIVSVFSGQDESFGGMDTAVGERANSELFFDAQVAIADRLHPSTLPSSLQLSEPRLLAEFNKWSRLTDWSQPHFIYFNLQAGHFPYYHNQMKLITTARPISRAEICASRRDEVAATYWNAIANADEMLGAIIQRLTQLGVYDNTLLLALGDHGESLYDDNFLGHGHAINDAQTRIPFVLNKPGISLNEPIGQTDVRDLILDVLVSGDNAQPVRQILSADGREKREKIVFQYVGDIGHPSEIGTVTETGKRTVLDFAKKSFFFSDLGRWFTYEDLRPPGRRAEYDRAQQLAVTFERFRNESWPTGGSVTATK